MTPTYPFFKVLNWVKNLKTILQEEISPPSSPSIQIFVSEAQSEWRYYFSDCANFWPVDTILAIFLDNCISIKH